MHIAIAGNIGSGKSTLTRMLAKHYGWEPRYEAVEHNPYLEDYYSDIHRWSFNLEVYFLKERFRDMLSIAQSEKTVIQTAPSTRESMSLWPITRPWATCLTGTTRPTWNCSNR